MDHYKDLSPDLNSFVQEHLGQPRVVSFAGWEHGESNVWHIAEQDRHYYLKQYRQPRKYQQELRAFHDWLPQLPSITPGLIAANERHHALLMTAVSGELMETSSFSRSEELELHRQAGQFLKQLHSLPFHDSDPLPYQQALLRRFESWQPRFAHLVAAQDIRAVHQRLSVILPQLSIMTRVPSHRDYSPRNWLADRSEGIQLKVIDFEHSRPDLWLGDFGRLHSEFWRDDKALQAVFFEGYGQTLSRQEGHILEVLEGFNALTTIAWAKEHADDDFERYGRRNLEHFLEQA